MKNLVLALLLALGVSTVSASANVDAEVTAVETIIADADVDAQTKAGALAWIKANPVKAGVAFVATASALTYAGFAGYAYYKGASAVEALEAPAIATWTFTKETAEAAKTHVVDAYNVSYETVTTNPKTSAGIAAAAVVVVAVIVDLARKDGYIRTACSKATPVVATPAAN